MNKNNHTTSTKCQYQAAAKNPTWCLALKWFLNSRYNMAINIIVPTITCTPWNPVAIKNVDPYTESANVNDASIYSSACKYKKYTPNKQVVVNLIRASESCLASIEWWAHVTVTPDKSKMAVLSNGTEKASMTVIPTGGHIIPISQEGANDEWKKAQKNLKKNITSLTINKSIPVINPLITNKLCHPW